LSDQFSVKNEEKKRKRKRKRVIHRLRRLNADYLEEGIEALRHQGIKRRRMKRREPRIDANKNKRKSYPQITQIGRRLFKRNFKRKRWRWF